MVISFFADAYIEIGTGHVMRCLALANACREANISTRFVGRIEDKILRARINDFGHELTALTVGVESKWHSESADWIVLDGYNFQSHDHRKIRDTGTKLLVIDDMANLDIYDADIILNQNFHANKSDYRLANKAKMLMGPSFSLLRKEFIGRRPVERNKEVRRLLVTLGGSDPQGATLLVIEALANIENIKFKVQLIAGSSNPHMARLEAAGGFAGTRGHVIDIHHYTNDMPGAMAWADIGVIAAGSTSLEVAYMGLPSLALILADNQASIADAIHSKGVAESLGWYDQLSAHTISDALERLAKNVSLRKAMTENGHALVDGLGVNRVVETILEQ